jgi:hypothetical protein
LRGDSPGGRYLDEHQVLRQQAARIDHCRRHARGAYQAHAEIDKRFVEYLLELSDGVTSRIIDILGRTALQNTPDKSKKVGLPQLQFIGARSSVRGLDST